jgi:hypothetical protein
MILNKIIGEQFQCNLIYFSIPYRLIFQLMFNA